jgi:signal transduction histidine kinase
MTIARGLKSMPENIKELQAYKDLIFAHQGLSDRWRFLSPLKLSGERTKVDITGQMILDYTHKFFGGKFEHAGIELQASDKFKKLCIYEQPARLYPVFINLINNSRYWVRAGDAEKQRILLDVQDDCVVIADNGPGVDDDDLSQLFTLFFTRKQRDGRGVGLYLCKTNLQAGGHTIRYENIEERKLLPGANFVIEFRGAKYE